MIYLACDYHEGAHESIIEKLAATNREQSVGYSEDAYCEKAAARILAACKDAEGKRCKVHFLVGGTQTNLTIIDAALRSHQGVIAAATGHINVHETGAIESCGHKVLGLPHKDGKITAEQIKMAVEEHWADGSHEHIVQPKMVYLSQPTELGTLYTKAELTDISNVCKEKGLYLFVDGARLAYGIMAEENDVMLPDLARLCDVFYIGGTKVGALFGEAVVITRDELKEDFRYIMKQKGGMLAKGRLLGIQFEQLFTDDLYWKLGKHADRLADKLRDALVQKGYTLTVMNRTNQIFVELSDEKLNELNKCFYFSYEGRVDEKTSRIRICTSWATEEAYVDELIQAL